MYGKNFPTGDRQAIELWCFGNEPAGGIGRYGHLRKAIDEIWNKSMPGTYLWNDWSELLLKTFSENKWCCVTGPAASWKTTSAAIYALSSFYADPLNTVVICTSTTLDGLRRRIWKEISRFHRLRPLYGHMVQSRNCIQYRKGHDDSGIFGLATDKGEIEKAIGKIIGFHARKMLIFVDEMPYTPEAIVEACVNLESGASRFEFKGLGNADDMLDPHGRMCEPLGGWDTIDVESESWQTRRGICVHLDGLKSPNIRNYGKSYPGLLNQQDIDTTAAVYGVDSPQFWQMRRGFWAPEGTSKTVLSMPMILKGRALDQASFDVQPVLGAALDPAFEGGDRCILRFGRCGLMQGRKVLALDDVIHIKTRNIQDEPVHYQILRQVKDICERRGLSPFHFAIDATGEGSALSSMFEREWSRDILRVNFSGSPTSRAVSPTNSRRSDQEYDRMVTDLWFYFRSLVENEQVRQLDLETATEFCRRWWKMKGSYISLEPKEKMKERTRRSPDYADAAVILGELFRTRGSLLISASTSNGQKIESPWRKFLEKRNVVSDYAFYGE
jgi:hypothetical protein